MNKDLIHQITVTEITFPQDSEVHITINGVITLWCTYSLNHLDFPELHFPKGAVTINTQNHAYNWILAQFYKAYSEKVRKTFKVTYLVEAKNKEEVMNIMEDEDYDLQEYESIMEVE